MKLCSTGKRQTIKEHTIVLYLSVIGKFRSAENDFCGACRLALAVEKHGDPFDVSEFTKKLLKIIDCCFFVCYYLHVVIGNAVVEIVYDDLASRAIESPILSIESLPVARAGARHW